MVSRLLILVLFLTVVPASGEQRQLCLSCHAVHYAGRAACSDCHHGNPRSERKNIAHGGLRAGKFVRFTLGDRAEKRERDNLMDQRACRRCHVSDGRGNRLAGSLDEAAVRKTAGELAVSIRHPVATMPNYGLDEGQSTSLVNSIFEGASGRKAVEAAPVKVHFSDSGTKSEDVFSKRCGSCHRLLTWRLGVLGSGDSGPNLSGLFSGFYPKTFRNGEVWTARNLGDWLKNPREIQVWARMQPVVLTEREMAELVAIFPVFLQSARINKLEYLVGSSDPNRGTSFCLRLPQTSS